MNTSTLIQLDKKHVWHPYASMDNPPPAYPVASAQGVRLTLTDGQVLIDGMSSWWCVVHGYNHPHIQQAMQAQMDKMSHVMFGGLTHEPAVTLAQRLAALTPEGLEKVFFCDSGSVAVEVAIKMALQYWHSQGKPQKQRLITTQSGYHGDTFQAMSVCDPINGMHRLFSGVLPKQHFCPPPPVGFDTPFNSQDLTVLEQTLKQHHQKLAAFIIEPIVQGAGGMRFYNPQWLKAAADLCQQYDVLFIADEIATGFGRTGSLFACEKAQVIPDIMCLGKAITGGALSFAATLTHEHIATSISRGEAHCFMHGPTYMGNPLACAAANASLDILQTGQWQTQVPALAKAMQHYLAPAKNWSFVHDVRVLGGIGVIELTTPVDLGKIQKMLVQEGVWVRPFGKLVYLMPAFIMSDEDLQFLCQGTLTALHHYFSQYNSTS